MNSLLTRFLLIRLVSVVAGAVGFYLPLAAIPMFAAEQGATTAAGLANGALLATTVAAELATPGLVARVGHRWALGTGLVLLGTPALVLLAPWGGDMTTVLVVNALRGVGFAVTVVAGGALTAALIPGERRGEGLALVGVVGGVPALLSLPLGAWAARHWGYDVIFLVTAAAPLLAVLSIPGLPRRDAMAGDGEGRLRATLRNRRVMRPAVIFAASASAAGVVVTFVPLALGTAAAWVAPVALLAQPAASTIARLGAGRLGDRIGQAMLLGPGVVLSVVGMAAMAVTSSGILVVAGSALFGTGFGVLQNATITLMYARVPAGEYGPVSAVWNGAYDLGMGLGAGVVGVLVAGVGFSWAFLVVAGSMVPALVLARRERRLSTPDPAAVSAVPVLVPAEA